MGSELWKCLYIILNKTLFIDTQVPNKVMPNPVKVHYAWVSVSLVSQKIQKLKKLENFISQLSRVFSPRGFVVRGQIACESEEF